MNQVECPFTKGQLEFMYWNKGYSLNEIAGISRQKGIAVTDFTVGSWLKRNEIPIRTISESKLVLSARRKYDKRNQVTA